MFNLAANAEMLFRDLPFADRVKKISELGFEVEIWDWTQKNIEELVATGATFSSMTGYISGDLTTEAGIASFLSTAEESLAVAAQLNCPRLNVHGTGLDNVGLPVVPKYSVSPEERDTAIDTLRKLAALGEANGRIFTIENLNTRLDHPGTPFATSAELLEIVREVNSPGLKLNLDLYHAQIDEGDLITRTLEALEWVGEIQVADVPGRCEPGTGEINYNSIAKALDKAGYEGTIAMEAWASSDSLQALNSFREAFTLNG